jgi:hypothetical protein
MAKTARRLAAALAISTALVTARAAAAADNPREATVVLDVDDFASLPPHHWVAAETAARRIFGTSGVRLVWAFGAKTRLEGALHLKVLVLSREMAERKILADGVGPNVLGQAASVTRRAYIFSHRVEALAARNGREVGVLLGRVIAHEVGHLLLGVNSHSSAGIMAAAIDLRTTANPGFDRSQASAIVAAVRSGN